MKKIYLAGAMTAFGSEDKFPLLWRNDLTNMLGDTYEVINPAIFDWLKIDHEKKEIMDWDLYQVRHSDIVVVNFTRCATSLGTQHELAVAYELRIPILGLNENNEPLHPWSRIVCQKIFDCKADLEEYIRIHY